MHKDNLVRPLGKRFIQWCGFAFEMIRNYQSDQYQYCPKCGSDIENSTVVCNKCGYYLSKKRKIVFIFTLLTLSIFSFSLPPIYAYIVSPYWSFDSLFIQAFWMIVWAGLPWIGTYLSIKWRIGRLTTLIMILASSIMLIIALFFLYFSSGYPPD